MDDWDRREKICLIWWLIGASVVWLSLVVTIIVLLAQLLILGG